MRIAILTHDCRRIERQHTGSSNGYIELSGSRHLDYGSSYKSGGEFEEHLSDVNIKKEWS